MVTADSRGNIDFFNRAAERLFGYASEEVIGKNVTMFIPERYRNAHKTGLERFLKTGEPLVVGRTVELEALKKDGTEFPISLSMGRWEAGEEPMFTAIIRDITERKKAEESLHDALQRLAIHDRQMPLGHITFDKEFGVVGWNPAAERIFGWSEDEVKGKHPLELFVIPQAKAHVSGVFAKLIAIDDSNYSLDTNLRKDGKTINCEWFITKLRDARGNFSGVCAMAHDVTEKTQLEKSLQIAQRMEAVGTLAGGIAHDFNNALTGIIGFGELLRNRMAGDKEVLHDLNEILRCAERASTLTRQLLTYARKQIIEPVNLSLNKVITDLCKLASKVVGEHIEIRTFLVKDLPTIRADVGQIEQVVMNLVLNARDAMPSGGQLLIETELVHLDAEYVRYHPYMKVGPYVVLKISDTGIGMDEKTRERVFEPFFTTKGPDKGTGLGLAMVYGIVKQHGGFIHLYSEPGKGTTFKIYLTPVEKAPDVLESHKPSAIRGGTETILLTDDDESVRMLAERTLAELGYTVLSARNGQDAVEIFSKNREKVSLALLDVVMPLKGGKEAYEEMHRLKPELKVIFMSGYTANSIHESIVLNAGTPFLAKPFGPEALAKKVREILDRD
jgi:two-component system, cell cycle sensor histidine kinase and response regulator CckA